MTKKEKIARIMADTSIPLAEKVVSYIISLPPSKLGALTTIKLAKFFETPIDTLDTLFIQYQKRSIDQYILFYKMQTAYDLMIKPKGKRPKLNVLSKRLGFNKYTAFSYRFKKFLPATPQEVIRAKQVREKTAPNNEYQTPIMLETTPTSHPGNQNE